MTEPAHLIAPRLGVPTATTNARRLPGEHAVEIADTTIVQASSIESLHDLALRVRHQQSISDEVGSQRKQVSA